jgi:hypothetical protein
MTGDRRQEQRVQDAVRRHGRARAFARTEKVISALLADRGFSRRGRRSRRRRRELGRELCARL